MLQVYWHPGLVHWKYTLVVSLFLVLASLCLCELAFSIHPLASCLDMKLSGGYGVVTVVLEVVTWVTKFISSETAGKQKLNLNFQTSATQVILSYKTLRVLTD